MPSSIDEKRKFFPVLKWNAEARVTQVWFPGVHSDVGGGHEESGLSDIALKWMIERAYEHVNLLLLSIARKVVRTDTFTPLKSGINILSLRNGKQRQGVLG
jgi:hypothetical protein